MESIEHSLELKDGRLLAYHTFPKTEEASDGDETNGSVSNRRLDEGNDKRGQPHPVLYFHGFPGCGLEAGATCALSVAQAGGRLYAIDRPGMGKTSSPYAVRHVDVVDNNNGDCEGIHKSSNDGNLDALVESIWELIENLCWVEFSIIGVSGGGPYALAMLASYLEKRKREQQPPSEHNTEESSRAACARLRNVCLVGAVCISAGLDGIKTGLDSMVPWVANASASRWSRLRLKIMAVSMGAVFNTLMPMLPLSWAMTLNANGSKNLPTADQEWMSDEKNIRPYLSMLQSMAVRGGYPGIYDDEMIVLRSNHSHEEVLRRHYGNDANSGSDDLPAIGIFQGDSDVNVPLSHAQFLHKSIFRERSELFRYDDLGHVSMIAGKSKEYAAFATATTHPPKSS
mmetsp:Transcript_51804/g.76781  ORF Transcript_51804/g.76781 Transcript_51804/m.76781 type:complete len:399 (+) Transcript_51804:29-1225(+)